MDTDKVKNNWLEPSRKLLQASSLKSYLGSLKLFYSFALSTKLKGSSSELLSNMATVRRWAACLSKIQKTRTVELQVKDSEERITKEEFASFMVSPIANLARRYLKDLSTGDPVNAANYNLVRNYLITTTIMANAQRVGAVINFSLRSFHFAQVNNSSHVCVVAHHKTGYRSPVTLVFNQEMWQQLTAFVSIRRRIKNFGQENEQENSPVFLAWPSTDDEMPSEMTSSLVAYAIKQLWRRSEASDKILTATKIRKATCTIVRSQHPELKEKLAQQMTHRTSTADKYYLLNQRSEEAIHVVQTIQKTLELCGRR